VFGLDPNPAPTTVIRGSVTDRALVRAALGDNRIDAIIHAGGLHKPNIDTHSREEFLGVNVTGTLNLLEEAVAQGVTRFVFTSSTSLMVSRELHAASVLEAEWLGPEVVPRPRNIYGVTKLAAENLCRLTHESSGMPLIVLRTSRFFPEVDDMAHTIAQTGPNTKANELLFRRLTVADAAEAHLVALKRAPQIGFDVFVISATPPFSRADCVALLSNAPAVVARYFPDYPALYAKLGWTMFDRIDRIYDPSRAFVRMGFRCQVSFRTVLDELARGRLPEFLTTSA